MGFYWKDGKDQLLARSGDLPPAASSSTSQSSSSGNPWTSFTMALREPTLLEGPLDLARFFITSLTFMRTMRQIDMLVDDVKVLEVERSLKGKERVQKKGLKQTSQAGMMTVTGVDATGMVITAKVMQWLAGMSRHGVKSHPSNWLYAIGPACAHCKFGQTSKGFLVLSVFLLLRSIDTISSSSGTSPTTRTRSLRSHFPQPGDSDLPGGYQGYRIPSIRQRTGKSHKESTSKSHASEPSLCAR